jgi:hypothetical protein
MDSLFIQNNVILPATGVTNNSSGAIYLYNNSSTFSNTRLSTTTYGQSGIGVNSSSSASGFVQMQNLSIANGQNTGQGSHKLIPSVGFSYYAWLELSGSGGTNTWYGGTVNGISGGVWA